MPLGSVLERIARAFLEQQRMKLGIPAEEQAATASADTSLLRRAQAAQAMQTMQTAPEEHNLRKRLVEAQIRNYDEPNRNPPPSGTPHYERDAEGNVTAVVPQPDGSFKRVPVGAIGTPQREPRPPAEPGRLSPLVDAQGRVIGSFHNVTGEVKPIAGTPAAPGAPATVGGTEVRKSPLPATMQQTAGMAQTVKENVDMMDRLADEVTAGPGVGHVSKLYQKVVGPSGPEGVFDFLGNAAVDLVYIKSGKQINENEMQILRAMIPNRARGNVKEQVRLFRDYADRLLRQYGVDEGGAVAGGPADGPTAPQTRVINGVTYVKVPGGWKRQ